MPRSEVAYLDFSPEQSKAITFASQTIADLGGPEAKGVALQARIFADQLEQALSEDQRALLQRFNEGRLSALMYRQMPCNNEPVPEYLPDITALAQSPRCQYLASRNQLLLELARHRSQRAVDQQQPSLARPRHAPGQPAPAHPSIRILPLRSTVGAR